MKNENKITLLQWNELTDKEKEVLRIWTVKRGYELDLVPSSSGTFDPICEYAALLNIAQMIEFLTLRDVILPYKQYYTKQDLQELWKKVKAAIE